MGHNISSTRTALPLLAALILLSVPQSAFAQALALEPVPEMGRGYFHVGYIGLDLRDLNASLNGAGYPSLDDALLTLGGGGFGTRGRFLIGGEGMALLGSAQTTSSGAYELSTGGGYGMLRVGYMAFTRGGLDVFPTVGIGGGAMNLNIAGRSAPTFDDVLADPARSSNLSTGMFLLDASLALHYRILFEQDARGEGGGMMVGVQAGYTFAPGDPSWDLDGVNSVAGGPALQIEGFHVSVSIGGWGRSGRQAVGN